MRRVWVIVTILTLQVLSAFFFISDILSSYVGFWTVPLSWELRELLEISAAGGLTVGVVFGALVLWGAHRDRHRAEERLRVASGAFMELLNERFTQWGLTRAEADVALFAIKGLSTAEIAALRGTSEGTVKADQCDLPQGRRDRASATPVAVHRRADRRGQCGPCQVGRVGDPSAAAVAGGRRSGL